MNKDIYDGETINVFEDEDFVYVSIYTNGITVLFTKDEWESFKDEFDKLLNGEPNNKVAL